MAERDVLKTEDMIATQGFSSGLLGLRTRSALRGGRRIGLFGMVGSREVDCPLCRRQGQGRQELVVDVDLASTLNKIGCR